jgi:hypothetical protein
MQQVDQVLSGEDSLGDGDGDQPCIPTADDQVAGRDPCLDLAKSMSGKSVVPADMP